MSRQAEIVKKLTDRELLANLYLTQILMLLFAFILSWWLFGSWRGSFQFLYFQWNHLLIGIGFGIAVVIIELFLYRILPKKWFDDGGINERVFKNRHPIHIVIISMVVAFSEEILFRGVIQSEYGIWIASLLFAIIHIRYLANPFLFLFTIGLSFSLGIMFIYTESLLAVIAAHFVIDCLLGLSIRYGSMNRS